MVLEIMYAEFVTTDFSGDIINSELVKL